MKNIKGSNHGSVLLGCPSCERICRVSGSDMRECKQGVAVVECPHCGCREDWYMFEVREV